MGLGVGAGYAVGWTLLLPLPATLLAMTVCSLLFGLALGPMCSAACGRHADGYVARLCAAVLLCMVVWICRSHVFRPATVETFRDAIVDITRPHFHTGTGVSVGLQRWGCVSTQPQAEALCAAFYSCALLELRAAPASVALEDRLSFSASPAFLPVYSEVRLCGKRFFGVGDV